MEEEFNKRLLQRLLEDPAATQPETEQQPSAPVAPESPNAASELGSSQDPSAPDVPSQLESTPNCSAPESPQQAVSTQDGAFVNDSDVDDSVNYNDVYTICRT